MGRRRGLVSGAEEGDDRPAKRPAIGGATLFERMANLSRGSRAEDEADEGEADDGSALNIPRFLGRQNNQ